MAIATIDGGRPTRFLIFSGRAGEIEGHLALPSPKQKKNFAAENLAKKKKGE